MAGFSSRSTVSIGNPASVLRAAAKALEPIRNEEVLRAWADTIEAVTMLEDSTHPIYNRSGLGRGGAP